MTFRRNGGPPSFSRGGEAVNPQVFLWITVVIGLIALLVLLLMGLSFLRDVYTDWLWFGNLGLRSVYTTILTTKVWLFFAGALVFALLTIPNVWLTQRFANQGAVPLFPWAPRLVFWGVLLSVLLLSIIFGSLVSGRWELWLKFMKAVPFGETDPAFHREVSFYVFTLPVYSFVQGWLLGALIIILLGVLGLYLVQFNLQGMPFTFSRNVRIHLGLLGAAVLWVISWGYLLDIYELVFSTRGAVFGAAYTDLHARVPALRLLIALTLASGILLVVSALLGRGLRGVLGALGLWIGAIIVVGNIYPGLVQRFQVVPNELAREEPYIQRNIRFTRQGFGLDRIQERLFPLEERLTLEDVTRNRQTLANIRLWDHRPLLSVYNQIQFIRLYYDFLDVDVDRYYIDGEYRQVMVAARELSPDKLPQEAQRWVNRKLQFTHGYGAAMSPVTEVTVEGRPLFFIQDIPPKGALPLETPQIYYGENTRDYVIVNSNLPEFDYPTEEGRPQYTKYQGKGGVQLSSLLRRLVYAWKFGDVNILISRELNPQSRIQYRRNIQERVSTVAPFLLLDSDPYLVVADGRLFWVQDAYTVTHLYPYSQRVAQGFNYIRNSVKVVIDAYDGDMQFYVVDSQDPLIQTYRAIFPDLFRPLDRMPPAIRAHIRYPLDLFLTQARVYLQYHMTDPTVFYNKEDQWSIPQELFFGSPQPMEPYYMIMRLPGEEREEFVLLLPFTPANRPNLVALLVARNDEPNYGELLTFLFPKGKQIDGPEQIEARIDNDPFISQQFTLWGQGGSTVIRGNLLVIPIGKTIIYVEPIYLQAEALAFPELKQVIVAGAKGLTMKPSVEEALVAILQETTPTLTATAPAVESPATSPPQTSQGLLKEELQNLSRAVSSLKKGLEELEQALERLQELAGGAP